MTERELFEKEMEKLIGKVLSIRFSEIEGGYVAHDLMKDDESTKQLINIFNIAFYIWQASANREGYKLVPVGDYEELVRSNRYKHEQNIELSKEVKILRERKKFYKTELKKSKDNFKVMPIEPNDDILKFLGGSKQEATMIYKAMIGVVNDD